MSETPGTEIAEKCGRKLSPFDRRKLMNELATEERKRSELARAYGVSPAYITQFAKKYETDIQAIRDRLDDGFSGLWIADKQARLAAYEHEYELAAAARNAGHHEWIKARTGILRNVAEEMGQLPNRTAAAIIVPVTHIIENVNLDSLKLTTVLQMGHFRAVSPPFC